MAELVPETEPPENAWDARVIYEGPKRILRTAVSSMASSDEFAKMMKREADRRRFNEAEKRAFLGDGLKWNWSVWKTHFPTYEPILDFIHAIQYVFGAARASGEGEAGGWTLYVKFITLCWQGTARA